MKHQYRAGMLRINTHSKVKIKRVKKRKELDREGETK